MDNQPISKDDLYGPSNPPTPEGSPTPPATVPQIPIEETPEIIPPAPTQAPPTPTPAKISWVSGCGTLLMFLGLFGVGMWLSSYLKQFFPGDLTGTTPVREESVPTPIATPTPQDPMALWKSYLVAGVSYKLPPDVLAPFCDDTPCVSRGTYLPGGTRFTVAERGLGKPLADFRGSAISDAAGTLFTTTDTTIAGQNAKLYTGTFAGTTAGGYGFTRMRGYMIEVTPTVSIELNHFSPTGVTADFDADDALFDQVIQSLTLSATSSATGTQ